MPTATASRPPGPYHLNILGLPARYKWQDLKDLVRKHASHGIHADLTERFLDGQSMPGGIVRVGRQKEAIKVYEYLSEILIQGCRLCVEIWDVTDSEPRFLMRNYDETALQAALARATVAQGQQVAGQFAAQPGPSGNVRYAVQPPVAAPPVYYQNQQHAAPVPTSYQVPPPEPRYATRRDGIPVNVSQGAALTEARGVFVSELNFNLREEDVKALFGGYGQIIKCKLALNHSGESKGTATVLYSSVGAARRAIEALNGHRWWGRVLMVRSDKEEMPVAPLASSTSSRSRAGGRNERLVVDGSAIRRRI